MYDIKLINRILTIYYNNKPKLKDLAERFMVPERTIYNWRQIYGPELYIGKSMKELKPIKLQPKIRTTRNTLLTDEVKDYIKKYINGNFNVTGKRMIKQLKKKFNISIELSTIYKWFKILNITYKKVHMRKSFVPKKKEKLLRELKEQIDAVENKNNIISIDESHFQLNMQQMHSWGLSGKKLYRETYNKKSYGVSLIMAINKEKVIGFKIVTGPVNKFIFKEFIESIYNKDYVYLMDNARIHKAIILKEYMEANNSKIIYNVPYNPETNPIERVFGILKNNIVKYNTQSIIELNKSIKRTIRQINSHHLKSFYEKSLNI